MFKKVKEKINFQNEVFERLNRIEEIVNNTDDVIVINERALNRINYWKEKYNNQHKEFCVYEVQAEKKILELETENKKLLKQVKQLEKENQHE